MNIEQERADLLPCPFCGCSMSMSAVARDWWRVAGDHDDDCILYDQRHDAPQSDDQKQALIEAWNSRAALQSQDRDEGYRAMAAEYQRWIDAYHQGMDYEDFLKKEARRIEGEGE